MGLGVPPNMEDGLDPLDCPNRPPVAAVDEPAPPPKILDLTGVTVPIPMLGADDRIGAALMKPPPLGAGVAAAPEKGVCPIGGRPENPPPNRDDADGDGVVGDEKILELTLPVAIVRPAAPAGEGRAAATLYLVSIRCSKSASEPLYFAMSVGTSCSF